MLTESRGEFSDLHSIFRLCALCDYEVDIEDVKGAVRCEMKLVSYLKYGYKSRSSKGVNSEKNPQTKRMKINDKNLA